LSQAAALCSWLTATKCAFGLFSVRGCVLYAAYPTDDSVRAAFSDGLEAQLLNPSRELYRLERRVNDALRGGCGLFLG